MRKTVAPAFAAAIMLVLSGCSFAASPPDTDIVPDAKMSDSSADIPVIRIDDGPAVEESEEESEEPAYPPGYHEEIAFDDSWEYADFSQIHDDTATLFFASENRKNVVIAVNAGHGTKGGMNVKTYCHPDKSPKTTGGSTPAGSLKAAAVSGGMTFADGAKEAEVALECAQYMKEALLEDGYDVLMLRDDDDAQLDNVARTVMSNNNADCMISLHWDGDGLSYDKGCFYISVPEKIKDMEPVATYWQDHDALGEALIDALRQNGYKINGGGHMSIDLTQTSYSTIPSVDIELGNAASAHDDETLRDMAGALAEGADEWYKNSAERRE